MVIPSIMQMVLRIDPQRTYSSTFRALRNVSSYTVVGANLVIQTPFILQLRTRNPYPTNLGFLVPGRKMKTQHGFAEPQGHRVKPSLLQ